MRGVFTTPLKEDIAENCFSAYRQYYDSGVSLAKLPTNSKVHSFRLIDISKIFGSWLNTSWIRTSIKTRVITYFASLNRCSVVDIVLHLRPWLVAAVIRGKIMLSRTLRTDVSCSDKITLTFCQIIWYGDCLRVTVFW